MNPHGKAGLKVMLLLLVLALMSAWTHYKLTVKVEGFRPLRLEHHQDVLTGLKEPPYRFRVLAPAAAEGLQALLPSPRERDTDAKAERLDASYFIIVFISFLVTYGLFFRILRRWFSVSEALVGCLLLFAVVPLSITGFFSDDDFVTLAFYAMGFALFMSGRDFLLPFVVLVGTLNREQIAFVVVFWLAYELAEGKLFRWRILIILLACVAAFLIPYEVLRHRRGNPPSIYTVSYHIENNVREFGRLIRVWAVEVLPFVVLALAGLRRAPRFFAYALATLPVYVLAFFLKGNLWELAKALPMYLILIPLSLFALFPSAKADARSVPSPPLKSETTPF